MVSCKNWNVSRWQMIQLSIKSSSEHNAFFIFTRLRTLRAEKFVGWKVHMMISFLPLTIFWPMISKYSNTDEKCIWIATSPMLENKPHLLTFHKSTLVNFWNVQSNLHTKRNTLALIKQETSPHMTEPL